jgi:hypothetical protein
MACPTCGCHCSSGKVGLPDPNAAEQVQISIDDLIAMCHERANKMGSGNPNRLLFLNCAYAIHQLATRLSFFEGTVH